MIAINYTSLQSVRPELPARVDGSAPSGAAPAGSNTDTVEISSAGRALSEMSLESSLRAARIRAIKSEIEAGTYETPEKLRFVADRLFEFLA